MSGRGTSKRGTVAAASPPAPKKTRVMWSPVTTPAMSKPTKKYTDNQLHLQRALMGSLMVTVRALEKKVTKQIHHLLAGGSGDLTDDSVEAIAAKVTPVLEETFGKRLEKLEANEKVVLSALDDLSKEVRDLPAEAAAAAPAQMTEQQIRSKGIYKTSKSMKDNKDSIKTLVDRWVKGGVCLVSIVRLPSH